MSIKSIKVVGDSTVLDFQDEIFDVESFPGMTTEQYIREQLDLIIDELIMEDHIVYSFGTNDFGNFTRNKNLVELYNKLPRGKITTTFILPANSTKYLVEAICWEFGNQIIIVNHLLKNLLSSEYRIHPTRNECRLIKDKIIEDINSQIQK